MDIKTIAENFDKALTERNIPSILKFFHENCEITTLNVPLKGKEGAQQWLKWLFEKTPQLDFEPVVIISEGNVFYEEFYAIVKLKNGQIIRSHQAETLIFEENKLKILKIFFNPLDFADIVAKDPISKRLIKIIQRKARKGLK
ncbi:hypothetical protein NEF87_004503 [Candidatus Lokiarchaeum ossiferum]|uniref:SnoaL-like domain-containing protein n=1 Tax=Candidatus Lokiarchaeum ossiferum TaxID=2951803 RepID=A0ABY6HXG3_9ARCH|nr:hypothetical protein NEF87_004503 [Candidatus Lokiarchaeum sp. B-35]